jgi:hypothetical protein
MRRGEGRRCVWLGLPLPFRPPHADESTLCAPHAPMRPNRPGHGPFSHVFENELLPRILGEGAASTW